MKKQENKSFRRKAVPTATCKCGRITKLRTRLNYPFGRKSRPTKTSFYKCIACGHRTN